MNADGSPFYPFAMISNGVRLSRHGIYRLEHAWPWIFAINKCVRASFFCCCCLCALLEHKTDPNKGERKVNRNRMKMNCVFSMCLCRAFTALRESNRLGDPIYGCDIDLSCIPNIIQHFHITLCISFAIPIATRATFSVSFFFALVLAQPIVLLIRTIDIHSFVQRFRFFGHSSSSFLWFRFIRLFAFFSHSSYFFCLQTAHKLFCECEPNETNEKKQAIHTEREKERGRRKNCQPIGSHWTESQRERQTRTEQTQEYLFKTISTVWIVCCAMFSVVSWTSIVYTHIFVCNTACYTICCFFLEKNTKI